MEDALAGLFLWDIPALLSLNAQILPSACKVMAARFPNLHSSEFKLSLTHPFSLWQPDLNLCLVYCNQKVTFCFILSSESTSSHLPSFLPGGGGQYADGMECGRGSDGQSASICLFSVPLSIPEVPVYQISSLQRHSVGTLNELISASPFATFQDS